MINKLKTLGNGIEVSENNATNSSAVFGGTGGSGESRSINRPNKAEVSLLNIRSFSRCISLLLLLLTACDPVTIVVGGTALAGREMICNQEGIGGAIDDSLIQTRINKQLASHDEEIFSRVELSVKHGTVVVIGYMKNEEQCEKTRNLISDVGGYKSVYFELSVGKIPTASQEAADSGITSRIKSSLLLDGNVLSRNYDVTTVKGVVYITGTAQTKYERDLVIENARNTSGVKRVASYIRINKNERKSSKKSSKAR